MTPRIPPAKMAFQIPAFALGVLGFILIFIALGTPAWQVTFAREIQQWIQSGLWISCQTRPAGMYSCTYTFTQRDFDFYTSADMVNIRTPAFYQWQRSLLHVFLICQLLAFIAFVSFCVSNHGPAERCSVVVYSLIMALVTFVSLGCIVAFLVLAHMVEYRFYTVSVSGIYEKHMGYSFYLALVGCLLYLVSLSLSVVYAFKVFTKDRMGTAGSLGRYDSRDDYRMAMSDYRFTNEDYFAMRDLPDLPQKAQR